MRVTINSSHVCFQSTNWVTLFIIFFFFNDTATTEIYTLSLHDALPIFDILGFPQAELKRFRKYIAEPYRSEEHTSELQSRFDLVCRLLLEKKKKPYTAKPSAHWSDVKLPSATLCTVVASPPPPMPYMRA